MTTRSAQTIPHEVIRSGAISGAASRSSDVTATLLEDGARLALKQVAIMSFRSEIDITGFSRAAMPYYATAADLYAVAAALRRGQAHLARVINGRQSEADQVAKVAQSNEALAKELNLLSTNRTVISDTSHAKSMMHELVQEVRG